MDQTWALMTMEKVGKTMDSKIENFAKKKENGKGNGMHWDWDGQGKCKHKFLSIMGLGLGLKSMTVGKGDRLAAILYTCQN